ncbi:hypothetical protein HDU76_003126 [Blyttiomyces sp. JEL0837]|nr:hypothetical protein HDU76_003126 [Blyttiomyces sp. JEL0837]
MIDKAAETNKGTSAKTMLATSINTQHPAITSILKAPSTPIGTANYLNSPALSISEYSRSPITATSGAAASPSTANSFATATLHYHNPLHDTVISSTTTTNHPTTPASSTTVSNHDPSKSKSLSRIKSMTRFFHRSSSDQPHHKSDHHNNNDHAHAHDHQIDIQVPDLTKPSYLISPVPLLRPGGFREDNDVIVGTTRSPYELEMLEEMLDYPEGLVPGNPMFEMMVAPATTTCGTGRSSEVHGFDGGENGGGGGDMDDGDGDLDIRFGTVGRKVSMSKSSTMTQQQQQQQQKKRLSAGPMLFPSKRKLSLAVQEKSTGGTAKGSNIAPTAGKHLIHIFQNDRRNSGSSGSDGTINDKTIQQQQRKQTFSSVVTNASTSSSTSSSGTSSSLQSRRSRRETRSYNAEMSRWLLKPPKSRFEILTSIDAMQVFNWKRFRSFQEWESYFITKRAFWELRLVYVGNAVGSLSVQRELEGKKKEMEGSEERESVMERMVRLSGGKEGWDSVVEGVKKRSIMLGQGILNRGRAGGVSNSVSDSEKDNGKVKCSASMDDNNNDRDQALEPQQQLPHPPEVRQILDRVRIVAFNHGKPGSWIDGRPRGTMSVVEEMRCVLKSGNGGSGEKIDGTKGQRQSLQYINGKVGSNGDGGRGNLSTREFVGRVWERVEEERRVREMRRKARACA